MSASQLKVMEQQDEPEVEDGAGGGNGNGRRLSRIEERLTRMETKFDVELPHLATKAWVLGGVVGGMVVAASLAIAVLKLFG